LSFPSLPGFTGVNAPSRVEADIGDLEVQGEIPRAPDAPEGEGWIVQALTNGQTLLTELNLFEATAIAKGPIATVKLPLRLKTRLSRQLGRQLAREAIGAAPARMIRC
jgi:carotenoid cleavage dioxygenase-like enzyme